MCRRCSTTEQDGCEAGIEVAVASRFELLGGGLRRRGRPGATGAFERIQSGAHLPFAPECRAAIAHAPTARLGGLTV